MPSSNSILVKNTCKFRKKTSTTLDIGRESSSSSILTSDDCKISEVNQFINNWKLNDIPKEKGQRVNAGWYGILPIQNDTIHTKKGLTKDSFESSKSSNSHLKAKAKANLLTNQQNDTRNFQSDVYVKSLHSVTKKVLNDLDSQVNPKVINNRLKKERIQSKEALNKSLPTNVSLKNVIKTESIGNLSNEKFPEKTAESNTSLLKKVSSTNSYLPVRSDQQKLSSKMFLGSLIPLGEKELADLRKWKLRQSKNRKS